MSGARAAWVRGGLVFFASVSAALGGYILVAPEGFFAWPWVSMGMAYNPHLLLDYGAMNLAAAVPLGWAAVTMSPPLVRATLASYSVWSVAHLLIHLRFRSHLGAHASVGEANMLVGVLAAGVVIAIALFLLALKPGGDAGGTASARARPG